MKPITLLFFLVLSTCYSCKKNDLEKSTPPCVANKIEQLDQSSLCDNSNVTEYLFQGNTVYVFDLESCFADGQSEVIDSDCTTLGYLGGIVGNTKINGEEFAGAMVVRVVWEK